MKRKFTLIILLCIVGLYTINELNCRNLCYWINNTENSIFVNIHNFIKPYILPFLCLFFIVKEYKNIGIVSASLGILKLLYSLFIFLKFEYWQFKSSNHYLSTFDNYEIEFFIHIIFSSIIYIITIRFFRKQ